MHVSLLQWQSSMFVQSDSNGTRRNLGPLQPAHTLEIQTDAATVPTTTTSRMVCGSMSPVASWSAFVLLVSGLAPNNSFKPKPLRGSA